MNEPEIINVDDLYDDVNTEQRVITVNLQKKPELLAHLLKTNDWKQVLVFCSAKRSCDNLVRKLENLGVEASAMHGNQHQYARAGALRDFKAGTSRVLIATDVAGRGIDIEELPCVINYELPRSPNDYTHRIGRTGRAGEDGMAISLISHDEYQHFNVIEKRNGIRLEREQVKGFEADETAPEMPVSTKKKKKPKHKRNKLSKKAKLRMQNKKPDANKSGTNQEDKSSPNEKTSSDKPKVAKSIAKENKAKENKTKETKVKGSKADASKNAKTNVKKSATEKPEKVDGSSLYTRVLPKTSKEEENSDNLHLFKRVRIGRTNVLRVVKRLPFGAYLSASSQSDEILLPKRYEPEDCKVDDLLKVFIYYDSEDRIIATTEVPFAQVDECAFLKVVDVNKVGAFMDIGLMKDLFVPYAEQEVKMEKGQSYVVRVYLDEHSGRIMASSKLDKFLLEESHSHQAGQAVDLMVYAETELGYKAVVGTTYVGLLYKSELSQPLKVGDKFKGSIKTVRSDNKLDLSISVPSEKTRTDLANQVLTYIKDQGGVSSLTDKSSPDDIYAQFRVSKKAYKKALGALYKRRLILIEKDKIKLV
ncbi:ATP-dependent RNA helicase RhlE [Nymphon striatum]|nr:ATP-dependent RNA helicase RhlE [Nymphon striatum]